METWLILTAICVLLLFLIVTITVLILYSGAFESVEVGAGRPHIGRVVIAYKFARGPYKEVGPLFFEVAKIAPDNRALGIYYDDPQKVEAHRLRYAVACILAEDEQDVDKDLLKKFEEEGFKIMELPRVDNVVRSSFPYKSTFSIFIGAQKVYPRLAEYIEEHELRAHPFLEIYDGNTIYFMAPLDKQRDFYVPESLQKFPGEEPYEYIYSEESVEATSEDGPPDEDGEESSLLHPSQVVKAAPLGTEEKEEEAKEAEAEPALAAPTGEEAEEQGTDEESTSSFEEVKMEGDEEKADQL